MRLLHVIVSLDPRLGGVSQAVRTMIAGLSLHGAASEVVSLDAPAEPWHQTDTFTLHALGPGQGPWCRSAQLQPWLLANLARFDAVVLHGLWLYPGYALRRVLRQLSAKENQPRLFVMPHGMLDPYFQRAAGRRLKAWRNWAYWRVVEGAVVNGAAGVLFTCETERRLAHEPFAPYRPQQELVVGLGVEAPPPFVPAMREAFLAKCPNLRSQPYLLFLSRLHEKKGVDLLLQAYQTLVAGPAASAPYPPVVPKLVVAGPGLDTPFGQQLQQLVQASPALREAVLFPDMLTGEAKWGAFYGCEAFVLPSHQENFGIAVVEALACGKPVLISNQVHIWRELEAGGAGLVADDTLAGTQHLLARWLAASAAEKQALSARAQQLYQTRYAVAPAAEKLLAALQ